MRKIILVSLSAVLLAAGCNASQPTSNTNLPDKTKQEAQNQSQDNSKTVNYKDQLLKTKVYLDLLRFYNVRQAFQSPQDKNKFYYITHFDDGESIWVLDTSKDNNYLQDEFPNIPMYATLLLNQKISRINEFRGVGFDGDKFVFTETAKENSPGPCSSGWEYGNLSYIGINDSPIIRKPYTISKQKSDQVQKELDECRKNL